jgi:hypothetical protein
LRLRSDSQLLQLLGDGIHHPTPTESLPSTHASSAIFLPTLSTRILPRRSAERVRSHYPLKDPARKTADSLPSLSSLEHFGIDLDMKLSLDESLDVLRKRQVSRMLRVGLAFGRGLTYPSPMQFDILFLSPVLIDKEAQLEIERLQPKATIFYTVSTIFLPFFLTAS